jgi:hypothetical protein
VLKKDDSRVEVSRKYNCQTEAPTSEPQAEDFFGDARTPEWPVLAQNGKKRRT